LDQLEGTVLLHVQTAAIAVDGDGRLGVFNPAAARVLGVPVDHVLGRHLDDLRDAEPALAAVAGVLRETRRTGVARARRQVTVPTPDGERTLGYTSSLLGGGAIALFFTDLTEALAEEQRAAEAQRFAEVGRIAGAMAHELKSPLATVELYVNLMRRAFADDPAAAQQLDVIKDQTRLCLDRLGAIMHSINPDAARAGGMTLTPVAPVVREVVGMLRRRNQGARVRLRVTGNGTRAAIAENDLSSVVTNLISNALEATGGSGPVSVSVRSDADAVTITVADRGPGLPEGDVFEAFYTTKSSGTGLGLWLVRRVVEDAGGSIVAGGRRGGGAVFTVTMPLPRHDRLRGVPILLIEDDAPLRRVATQALENCGARVTAAVSGKDVALTADEWSCAVLDYHLPDMHGVEIATRLAPDTPVLMVSSDPAAGVALAEVHGRRAWYLPKPFETDVYLDLVSLLVGGT
jgi:signal transduction histidine kinase/CheY-like chemotaxis protein